MLSAVNSSDPWCAGGGSVRQYSTIEKKNVGFHGFIERLRLSARDLLNQMHSIENDDKKENSILPGV
jgi:hypothetical protein